MESTRTSPGGKASLWAAAVMAGVAVGVTGWQVGQAPPGVSQTCSIAYDVLQPFVAGAQSAYDNGNAACEASCQPALGVSCTVECAVGLPSLEQACHDGSGTIFRQSQVVVFVNGQSQTTSSYRCLPASCSDGPDLASFATAVANTTCTSALVLPFVTSCTVVYKQDDPYVNNESSSIIAAVVVTLVLALMAGLVSWRLWAYFRAGGTHKQLLEERRPMLAAPTPSRPPNNSDATPGSAASSGGRRLPRGTSYHLRPGRLQGAAGVGSSYSPMWEEGPSVGDGTRPGAAVGGAAPPRDGAGVGDGTTGSRRSGPGSVVSASGGRGGNRGPSRLKATHGGLVPVSRVATTVAREEGQGGSSVPAAKSRAAIAPDTTSDGAV